MTPSRATRPGRGRVVGGVARGLADHLGLPVWLVRVAFVVLALAGGIGLVLYAAFWAVLPLARDEDDDAAADSDAARGTDLTRLLALAALVLGVGLLLLAFQIFQWYLVAATGQSLAKRWLGMQIVRLDGTPPGFLHGVVLRSWILLAIAYIPYLGQLVALVDALMILGEERRCLHDHIAGTRVIVVSRA